MWQEKNYTYFLSRLLHIGQAMWKRWMVLREKLRKDTSHPAQSNRDKLNFSFFFSLKLNWLGILDDR